MAGDTPDVRVHRLHGRALTAETDASGRFRIHGVPEGGVRLEFTKEHFVAESQHFRPRDPSVDTTFGPEDEFLTDADSEWRARIQRERSGRVVLRRGREVRGRVLTHTGHAAAGAEVTLTPGNAVTEGDPWRTTCDEEGRFVLPGVWRDEEFDSYQLLGLKVLHAGSAVHVEQPLGEGEIDVRLEKGARAQGRILRADGEPLSDAKVRVLGGKEFVPSADWGAPPTWEWGLGVDTARTNDEGYFVLSNLHAGPYVLAIHDPAEERRWIEEPIVAGGPEVEITVGVGAFDKVVLEGRAVDAVTGEPIEEFTLVPMIDGSGSHYAFESRVGEFRLAGLDARPLELSARADGYAPWARELAPERHGVLPVEVRMFPLRTLRFRLVESGGEPTQRTFGVSVEDLEGRTLDLVTGPSSWTNRVRVGPSQPGVLHGLPATRSTLVVNDGLTEQRFAVDLTLPREDELEFTLEEVVPREEGGLVFLVTGPSERAGEELARELERLMTDGDRAGFAAKMAEVLRSAPRLPIELHGECVEHGESFHAEITAGEEMPFAVAVRTSRGTGYGGGAGTAWKQELEFPGVTVDGIVAGTWSVRVSRAGRTLLERTVETVSLDLEPGEMPPLTVLRVQ